MWFVNSINYLLMKAGSITQILDAIKEKSDGDSAKGCLLVRNIQLRLSFTEVCIQISTFIII